VGVSLLAQNTVPGESGDTRLPAKLTGEFTPIAPPEIANRPVPRLPDGHPDLSGPWVGGGSNSDIEKDGGLKPGELPLLPWAKQLRDSRKEEDEPYLYCTPMSVPRVNPYPWRFIQSVTAQGMSTIYVMHENGDAAAAARFSWMAANIRPRTNSSLHGGDIPSAAGTATRWSSTLLATTTSSGSTATARRTPRGCTRLSGGRVSTTAR